MYLKCSGFIYACSFQNKMNLTSTLWETAVTGLCLRQKLKIRISAHSPNIDIFSIGDRMIFLRNLLEFTHHVNSLITWVSLTVQV